MKKTANTGHISSQVQIDKNAKTTTYLQIILQRSTQYQLNPKTTHEIISRTSDQMSIQNIHENFYFKYIDAPCMK